MEFTTRAFDISYKIDDKYQAIVIISDNESHAKEFFKSYKPLATLIGITEIFSLVESIRKNKPIVSASIVAHTEERSTT